MGFDWLYGVSAVFQSFLEEIIARNHIQNYNYQVFKASTYPLHKATETLAHPIESENVLRKTIIVVPMLKYNDG